MKHNHKKRYPMGRRSKRCANIAMMIARKDPSNIFGKACMVYSFLCAIKTKERNRMRDAGVNPYKRKGEAI